MLQCYDFLKHSKIILDCDAKIMKLKNKNNKLHFIESESNDTMNLKLTIFFHKILNRLRKTTQKTKRRFSRNIFTLKLTEDHVLEANEIKIIELQCPQNFSKNYTILLESLTSN